MKQIEEKKRLTLSSDFTRHFGTPLSLWMWNRRCLSVMSWAQLGRILGKRWWMVELIGLCSTSP
jgi:hypothetical protein